MHSVSVEICVDDLMQSDNLEYEMATVPKNQWSITCVLESICLNTNLSILNSIIRA